ncbi:protein kinase [Streptomyces sp. V17-9]|uniref:protein kinase n=1 Tax=Streptomyces sp. V17-9 TaxID=2831149 RepID=UPI001BAF1A05|nr:protein kinase [Streptomyces sp. V17-9]QUW93218.1 Serine/threonine-protein kinase StkP [Streptomyces sp. V17-9]
MDDYAGRVLADRYRLPLPPSDEYELTESRAFDTYSGQEVLVRQVPLPEVVEAEVLDADGLPDGFTARDGGARHPGRRSPAARGGTGRPADPVVRRAVEAAQAAAAVPDHPRLDQVFDVFAEGGSLWVVSELVAARPLAALLAEQTLTPYRAAEVASDVLLALRVLHSYGWVHRNITARTVLVCDDGRVMLTGLAVGAAEEALCGYDPVPRPPDEEPAPAVDPNGTFGPGGGVTRTAVFGPGDADPEAARRAAIEARGVGGLPVTGGPGPGGSPAPLAPASLDAGGDARAARAGAIAAYRAGARAAARVQEAQNGRAALPGARPAPDAARADGPGTGGGRPGVTAGSGGAPCPVDREAVSGAEADTGGGWWEGAAGSGGAPAPYAVERAAASDAASGGPEGDAAVGDPASSGDPAPPGRIADPYGVRTASWHGATPRTPGDPAFPAPRPEGDPTAGSGPVAGRALPAARQEDTAESAAARRGAPAGGAALPYETASGSGALPYEAASGSGAQPYDASESGASPQEAASGAVVPPREGTAGPGVPAQAGGAASAARWDDLVARTPAPRGPATALAAERSRQTRMAVVGPVTERWAPEQAGPVHENWQLAAPIGPATDLWALGALLFRAVQGHAPYPEESTAELVQIVCAEPPAFAEECGPLRPVVESLLRQDPTERIEFEELSGWLRSLVRSAPEPEAGLHVIAAPPVETGRLPIVRRRGELVRRRRVGLPAHHGRHKRGRAETGRSPRSLGRTLLLLILLALAGAVAYAMFFMPKSDTSGAGAADRTGAAGEASQAPPAKSPEAGGEPRPEGTSPAPDPEASRTAGGPETQSNVADGFTLRKDAEGFRIAVAEGWSRTPRNGSGQVVYGKGDFELIVVPGRDRASEFGDDPMTYQRDSEPELASYRASSWATSSGLKTIEVGGRTMAEGQFTWTGAGGELYVRNVAMLIDGRYHVVQVRGPEAERDEVSRLFEQASATYQYTR